MQGSEIVPALLAVVEWPLLRLAALVVDPTSSLSALSLLTAFLISALFLTCRRQTGKRTRAAVLIRALLPRRWRTTPSARADMGLTVLNAIFGGALFGWALLSSTWVEVFVSARLYAALGVHGVIAMPPAMTTALLVVVGYLAFEASYFVDHLLKHHVPTLWHFHRVHHSAETLSPLTNYRVHPVDSVVFYNLVAVAVGTATAVCRQFVGPTGPVAVVETNTILLAAQFLLTHLQHTHMWIAFTGPVGRLILSPAHHQLHHSADSRHFNRNFGFTLAIFDRWAGTLLVPASRRERLVFGAGSLEYDPHSASGLLWMPFVDAAAELRAEPAAPLLDSAR